MKQSKLCALVTLLVVGLWSASALAIKPGDTITPENAKEVQQLVSPGIYYMVAHGMRLNIVAPDRVDWPPPYKEATEKYSGQVRLAANQRSLDGYVAGQPFPMVDTNDPHVAVKIMWNNVFRPISSDDYDLRFFDCQVQYLNRGGSQNIINDIWVGHYAGYDLVGRTEVEPLPIDPDFKISDRLWLFGLYPILAPQDSRGNGLIRYRYAGATHGDDDWTWEPGSRRVRRLNESLNSSATGTQQFDPDHYSGFNPKIEFYDFKFLGEKEMLACVHAAHSPEVTCPYDGGATACPENWEMRHLYVVEATPRRALGTLAGALAKYNVLYLDSEVWFQPYVDTYDRTGQLWKTNLLWLTYRDRPVPDARVAIYPFKREFVTGSMEADLQGSISTMCYLPGQHTPERECWYINMGAVDRAFFTVQAMTKAAP